MSFRFSAVIGVGALPAIVGDGEGGAFSTIDCKGTATTLFLVFVVMVAVALIPGRKAFLISSGMLLSTWMVTLNSFAS